MFIKVLNFLLMAGFNGVIALFVSVAICVVLAILFSFALLPISVIFGDDVVIKISNFVNLDYCARVIYAIIWVSMMMDDLGVPNFKTTFKKWKDNRKRTA